MPPESVRPQVSPLAAFLGTLAAASVRRRWWVVGLWLALALGSVVLAAGRLGINTDTTDMLSPELGFRKAFNAYRAAFPQGKDNLVIVVSGPTGALTDRAARRLAAALRQEPRQFRSVFFPPGDAFFRRNGLLYLTTTDLEALTERLAEAQPVLGLFVKQPNIAGLFTALETVLKNANTSTLPAHRLAVLLDAVTRSVEALATGRSAPVRWSSVLGKFGTGGPAVIVTRPALDFRSLSPAKKAMQRVREIAGALGLRAAQGYRVRLTGGAAIASEEIASVSLGASQAGLLSLALVIILLFAGLRQPWSIFSVVSTLIVGLACTLGFATLAIGELNLISVAFAVLFIGLGVDFGIHFALRAAEMSGPDGRPDRYKKAAVAVGPALMLVAASASLAFLAFLFTDYRGVAELGLIAAAGMAIALVSCLTLLPAFQSFRPLKQAGGRAAAHAAPARGRPVDRWILLLSAVLVVGALAAAPLARFDRNPLNLKDPVAESVRTAVSLVSHPRFGATPLQVMTPSAQDARRVSARLRALPEVRTVRTVFSFVPSNQAEKRDLIGDTSLLLAPMFAQHPAFEKAADPIDLSLLAPSAAESARALKGMAEVAAGVAEKGADPALKAASRRLAGSIGRFMKTQPDASRLKLLNADVTHGLVLRLRALAGGLNPETVTLANLPADLRSRYVSPGGSWKVEVLPRANLQDNKALKRFVAAVQRIAPSATGSPAVELFAGNAVIEAFLLATAIAAIFILLLLFVVLRRPLDVVLVIAPVAAAGVLTVGTAVLLDRSFNFANIIAMPLLIGLGAAGGIHVVTRWRRRTGHPEISTTPRAILFSALTTVASFGTLAVSPHRGTASMGELLMIAIGWSLVCTLIVLPAALRLFADRDRAP